jgi:hypothetical protein
MTALVMGLAFGPEHITKRWDSMVDNDSLSRTFDETAVYERLSSLLSVYEQAQVRHPILAKDLKKQYPLARFSGYIAYALYTFRDEDPSRVVNGFVDFIVASRRDPAELARLVTPGNGEAWKLARWVNGYNAIFDPDANVVVTDDDDDDSD